MKKVLAIVMVLVLTLSLAACGGEKSTAAELKDGEYKSVQEGNNGEIEYAMTVKDGKGTVSVVNHEETPELGDVAIEEVINKYNETGSLEGIDTVSGATNSSQATIDAIQDMIDQASK